MLSIQNLRFGYTGTPILQIPQLNVRKGDHLLVEGQSGSGKTSLLFLLAGFLKLTSGTIKIADTDLQSLSSSKQDAFRGHHIGFVFQQPHLMAPLTVLQNLLVANTMAGNRADAPKAHSLLKQLGMDDFAHRYPAQLSQGQMQRVAIARALMNTPQIVLADEPTSALDDTTTEQVINLLLQTAEASGAQVIVTTHDARVRKRFKSILNLNAKA